MAVGGGAHKLLRFVELQILSGSSVRLQLLILLRNEMAARDEERCTSFPPLQIYADTELYQSIRSYITVDRYPTSNID